jgi:hypothetical protein
VLALHGIRWKAVEAGLVDKQPISEADVESGGLPGGAIGIRVGG